MDSIFLVFDVYHLWFSLSFQFYITGYKQRKKVTFLIIFEWLFIYANCPDLLIQCSALNTTMTRASSVRAQERHVFGWTFPRYASLRLCREIFWTPTKAECTRMCVDLESNLETHLEPQVFFLVITILILRSVLVFRWATWRYENVFATDHIEIRQYSFKEHLKYFLSKSLFCFCGAGNVEGLDLWYWVLYQFSCSVMSNCLQPHGLWHNRLPCPSPTPGTCSNSCPLSQWCHPTISSSVTPFFFCLLSFPASGSFPKRQLFMAKVLELQHQSFQRKNK